MEFDFRSPPTPHPASYEQILMPACFAPPCKETKQYQAKIFSDTQRIFRVSSQNRNTVVNPIVIQVTVNGMVIANVKDIIIVFSLSKRKTSDSAENVCWFFMSVQLGTVFCGKV